QERGSRRIRGYLHGAVEPAHRASTVAVAKPDSRVDDSLHHGDASAAVERCAAVQRGERNDADADTGCGHQRIVLAVNDRTVGRRAWPAPETRRYAYERRTRDQGRCCESLAQYHPVRDRWRRNNDDRGQPSDDGNLGERNDLYG